MDPNVCRNHAGSGSTVREADIRAAFEFLDAEGRGIIKASTLRKRLGAFYRNIGAREARMLMNHKAEMTFEDLKDLILENEIKTFDPVMEAFKVYDPEGKGFVDPEFLRNVFENIGFGRISDEDLAVLLEAADHDGDGQINVEDFRRIGELSGDRREEVKADGGTQDGKRHVLHHDGTLPQGK